MSADAVPTCASSAMLSTRRGNRVKDYLNATRRHALEPYRQWKEQCYMKLNLPSLESFALLMSPQDHSFQNLPPTPHGGGRIQESGPKN
eukprot:7439308-Karenia_brevis.AAC.1